MFARTSSSTNIGALARIAIAMLSLGLASTSSVRLSTDMISFAKNVLFSNLVMIILAFGFWPGLRAFGLGLGLGLRACRSIYNGLVLSQDARK